MDTLVGRSHEEMSRIGFLAASAAELLDGNDNDQQKWLSALLLNSEEKDIRLCGKKIISVAMVIVSSDAQFSNVIEPTSQPEATSSSVTGTGNEAVCNTPSPTELNDGGVVCLQVVDYIIRNLLRVAQLMWRRVHAFFSPVSVLAKNSAQCRTIMQQRDYLASLLSLFLCQDTPYPELIGGDEPKNHKSRSMCEGKQTADFTSLLVSIGALLPNSANSGMRRRSPSEQDIFVESKNDDGDSNCEAQEESGRNSASTEAKINEQTEDDNGISDEISSRSLEMIQSSVFMYRLLKVLDTSESSSAVFSILQFALKDSKELTDCCVSIIVSAMKKEDGRGLRAPLRCAMLLCKIKDSITGWRVSNVMQKVVVEIKSNLKYVQATDTSLTMLLRICKHSPSAAEWFRLNYSARLTWMESYLITRKGGLAPNQSTPCKPIMTTSGSTAVDKSPQGVAAALAAAKLQAELNLQLIRRIVNKNKDIHKDSAKNASVSSIKFSRVGIASGGYDSDDDPLELVGLRVQVQWKSIFYPAEIASFDPRTSLHMVHCDDGDKVNCNMKEKVW
eukprot:CAMPEP_0114461482 /NCGR_PEP_ID=MMETSP0104-20121206/6298_1 /TAXON_ID=37642 ORGANISM="Paraphysomonas imperforata, Strain PA2" /NCGR_SAMPLE_ID=MMETSP0104 /ASSEMBLY_ACC=CAM_ASM_000202 /LENGTH=559 /DNA_ID=CAMNT_0001634255 /DNA_START=187 /DNA_END=1864 /DNA_ORIENTATION=+